MTDSEAAGGKVTDGFTMRRSAVDFGVSLIINIKNAILFVSSLEKHIKIHSEKFSTMELSEFYRSDAFDMQKKGRGRAKSGSQDFGGGI